MDPRFIFQMADSVYLDEDGRHGFGEALAVFKAGGDITLRPHLANAVQDTLEAQREVVFDETTLDMAAVSVRGLSDAHSEELQCHPKVTGLALLLCGASSSPRPGVALAASRVYLELLRCFRANATSILNAFYLRGVTSHVSQVLQSYGTTGRQEQEEQQTQAVGTQQSIALTQNLPQSQAASQIPASQRPRQNKPKGGRKQELPDDWQDVHTAVHELIGVFADGMLINSIQDHSVVTSLLEALSAYPTAELTGPFGPRAPQPSRVTELCHDALRAVMSEAVRFEVGQVRERRAPPPAQEGEEGEQGGEEARQEQAEEEDDVEMTTVTTQHIVLPLLLPVLHLTPVYTNNSVRVSDAARMQEAVVELIKTSEVTPECLERLIKLFLLSGERRPRTEPMAQACRAGVELINALPVERRNVVMEFMRGVLCSDRVYRRLLAVELAHAFLSKEDSVRELSVEVTEGLISVLFDRCNDVASAVRTKALSNLSLLMTSIGKPDSPLRPAVKNFFEQAGETLVTLEDGEETNQRQIIVASVLSRAREEKALVRKAAVDLLHQLFDHSVVPVDQTVSTVLDLMDSRIEPSVLVRRQAVLCAWAIANNFAEVALRFKMIAHGLIANFTLEAEEFVQTTIIRAVHALIFKPLEAQSGEHVFMNEEEVWQLLAKMTDGQLRSLGKVCQLMLDPSTNIPSVGAGILRTLMARIDANPEKSREAWAILPIVARGRMMRERVDSAVILRCFDVLMPKLNSMDLDAHSVLQNVLALLAELKLEDGQKEGIVATLEQRLIALSPHPNLIDACVQCYAKMEKPSRVRRMTTMFAELCTVMFYNMLNKEAREAVPRSAAAAGLHCVTLEELPVAVCILGCLILTDAGRTESEAIIDRLQQMASAVCNAALELANAEGEYHNAPFDAKLSMHADASAVVVKHAFLCVARLCRLSKGVCKKGVPLLLRGAVSGTTAIKTVCLNGLADLSVQFPGIVDKYLANICGSLNDVDPRVRLTALTLITQLLAESFVKPRPFLVFELLASIADKVEAIAGFARYALLKVLLLKDPLVLANHFSEALFVFNDYRLHSRFNQHATRVLKLRGDDLRSTRIDLLRFVATQLRSEKDMLRVYDQLHDVLDHCTVDGKDGVKLNVERPEGRAVLKDVLMLLQTPEFNLAARTLTPAKAEKGAEKAPEEEDEDAQAAMRKQMWQGVVRMKVRDVVGPVICSVYQYLRELRSPLQRYVIRYAAYASQDYENDLNEILTDEQLQREVRSIFEEARRNKGNGRRAGPLVRAQTPSPLRRRSRSRNSVSRRSVSRPRASVSCARDEELEPQLKTPGPDDEKMSTPATPRPDPIERPLLQTPPSEVNRRAGRMSAGPQKRKRQESKAQDTRTEMSA
eukprot:Hpha_TRINITY_DN16990_c0_g1::TRINITY_DN16990_c0_g1_i1::g.51739::m.51739/K11491/NCAPD3; condensin-2 complex subunit D3